MKSLVLCFVIVLVFPSYVRAELRMTEVYPAPEKGFYEWVEIYNDGPEPVDATKYSIFDLTGSNIAISKLLVQPQEYIVATASGTINNSGDTLFLKNGDGMVIQTVTTPRDISSNQSFVLCGTDWVISSHISQGSSNESACIPPSPTTKPTVLPTPKPTEPPIGIPSGIYVSEAMVYPEKNAFEWVELYNSTQEPVTLTKWQLDDVAGGSNPIELSIFLPAQSYKVITLTSSIFNNSSDEVRLLDSKGNVVDSMSYTNSQQGFTISKGIDDSAGCNTTATFEQENTTCTIENYETEAESQDEDVIASATSTTQAYSLLQSPMQFSTSAFPPALSPAKKSEPYTGKIYTLEKIPKPSYYPYAQASTLSCLLSCALHFMYSMYRYKHIYA